MRSWWRIRASLMMRTWHAWHREMPRRRHWVSVCIRMRIVGRTWRKMRRRTSLCSLRRIWRLLNLPSLVSARRGNFFRGWSAGSRHLDETVNEMKRTIVLCCCLRYFCGATAVFVLVRSNLVMRWAPKFQSNALMSNFELAAT